MTNEAPERIWITSETMSLHSNPSCETDEEYIRRNAACVEVNPGYEVGAAKVDADGNLQRIAEFSEALTIRTVEDVRREVAVELMAAIENLGLIGDHPDDPARVVLRAQFNTPAPSREKRPNQQVGTFEGMPEELIDEAYEQPTPSPEPVEVLRFTLTGGGFAPEKLIRDPDGDLMRYDQAHLVVPQPDELRKAKAEAWEEGYSARTYDITRYFTVAQNPYAAPEGGE